MSSNINPILAARVRQTRLMQQQRDAQEQERLRQARLMQHQQAAHDHARQQQEAYQARFLQYQQAAHEHARQQQEATQALVMQYQQASHDHARHQQEVVQVPVMQYQQAHHYQAHYYHCHYHYQADHHHYQADHYHDQARSTQLMPPQSETSEKDSPNHLHVAHVGECVVCLEKSATHAIIPCGHQALCETCAGHYKPHGNQNDCPVCRGPVDGVFKIFVAAPVTAASSSGSGGGVMSQPQVGIEDNSRVDTTVPYQDSDVMSSSQDQFINHLIEMGFEAQASKDALESSEGNAETAIAILLSRKDSEQASWSVGNEANAIVAGEAIDLQSESPPRRSRDGRRSTRSMSQSQPRRHQRRNSSRHRQRSHRSRRSRSRKRR